MQRVLEQPYPPSFTFNDLDVVQNSRKSSYPSPPSAAASTHSVHGHSGFKSPEFGQESLSNLFSDPLISQLDFGTDDFFFPPPPPPANTSFESMNFFSTGEQDDMLDFLRDFDAADPWEFNPLLPSTMPAYPGDIVLTDDSRKQHSQHSQQNQHQSHQAGMMLPSTQSELPLHHQYGNGHALAFHQQQQQHMDQGPFPDSVSVHSSSGTAMPEVQTPQAQTSSPSANTTTSSLHQHQHQQQHHHHHHAPPSTASSSSPSASTAGGGRPPSNGQQEWRPKPVLSGPQKRMNHVKSEKRRRDTIRDGYLTLTKMLSPSGPGAEQIAIPRRGRPKGSGRTVNGKKTGKGKSGVLFRAVEYIRFMEEGCEALERECERLERLALGVATNTQGLRMHSGNAAYALQSVPW